MYDPKLVRWNTYDPMAEKYYGINPYVYCAGDPVNLVDPKGTATRAEMATMIYRLMSEVIGDRY